MPASLVACRCASLKCARRNGDDRVRHLLAQVLFRRDLQLLKNHRGDLGRRILLAADLDPRVAVLLLHDAVRHARRLQRDLAMLPAHEALD